MHPSTHALQSTLRHRLESAGLLPRERDVVERAMKASFTVHDGALRPGGVPYPDHPLSVALRLLDAGAARTTSHLVAALLHDAVEDAPERLVDVLQAFPLRAQPTPEDALRAIAEALDPLAAEWVRQLTNPDFDAAVGHLPEARRAEASHALYRDHVVGLVDGCPEAFLIKFEDFSENALSLHLLQEGPRRQKLVAKYGPVVRALRDRLERLDVAGHPVTPHRARMLAALERAWTGQ
jgi:hypothetical protein